MTKRKDLRARKEKARRRNQGRQATIRDFALNGDEPLETQPAESQGGLLGLMAGLLPGGGSQQNVVSEESAVLTTAREELARVDADLEAIDVATGDPEEFRELRGQRRSLLEKIDALTGART